MNDKEKLIRSYFALHPTKYPVVESFQLNQEFSLDDNKIQVSLTVSLRSTEDHNPARLGMSFTKVRNLKLDVGTFALQMSLLNIVPLDDQWEDVNYRVFEDGGDVEFSFLCAQFSATLI